MYFLTTHKHLWGNGNNLSQVGRSHLCENKWFGKTLFQGSKVHQHRFLNSKLRRLTPSQLGSKPTEPMDIISLNGQNFYFSGAMLLV